MAKELEKNELQQAESIPEKPKIEKLKLTADDLQQYGRSHADYEDTVEFGLFSWFTLTCSLTPYSYIIFTSLG